MYAFYNVISIVFYDLIFNILTIQSNILINNSLNSVETIKILNIS